MFEKDFMIIIILTSYYCYCTDKKKIDRKEFFLL